MTYLIEIYVLCIYQFKDNRQRTWNMSQLSNYMPEIFSLSGPNVSFGFSTLYFCIDFCIECSTCLVLDKCKKLLWKVDIIVMKIPQIFACNGRHCHKKQGLIRSLTVLKLWLKKNITTSRKKKNIWVTWVTYENKSLSLTNRPNLRRASLSLFSSFVMMWFLLATAAAVIILALLSKVLLPPLRSSLHLRLRCIFKWSDCNQTELSHIKKKKKKWKRQRHGEEGLWFDCLNHLWRLSEKHLA